MQRFLLLLSTHSIVQERLGSKARSAFGTTLLHAYKHGRWASKCPFPNRKHVAKLQ